MNMVTDRTNQDVSRWKELRDKGWGAMTDSEKEEWLSPHKGCYNYTDLNRVENAVLYVVELLKTAGYDLSHLETKTDWLGTDKPTKADFDRYMGNIAKLRAVLSVYSDTPTAPTTAQNLNYQIANDLEKILVDVAALITNLKEAWYYAGDIYSGEV